MVEQKQTKESSRYVFCVRHGERCDWTTEYKHLYKGNYDGQLTPKGRIQAKETGQFLKKYLETIQPLTKVIIECSPFVRVMATAAIIAVELGLQNIPVEINYQYSEF